MKVWEMLYDQNYENVWLKDEFAEDIEKFFCGTRVLDIWKVPDVATYFKGPKAEEGDYSDIFSFDIAPVFTQKAVNLLSDLVNDYVEFLPLNHEYHKCYAVNVIKVINCLDKEKSDIEYFSGSNKIMNISKYVFKKGLYYPPIFKIDSSDIGIFVTDEFIKVVEDKKITGLDFFLLWNSEEE